LKLREKRLRRGLIADIEIIAQLRVADKTNRSQAMTKRQQVLASFNRNAITEAACRAPRKSL
jgi:hypothetical protein